MDLDGLKSADKKYYILRCYKYYGKLEETIMARVVTSLRIDDELWKEAKIYAIRKGITLAELLEQLLKKELEKVQASEMEAS